MDCGVQETEPIIDKSVVLPMFNLQTKTPCKHLVYKGLKINL